MSSIDHTRLPANIQAVGYDAAYFEGVGKNPMQAVVVRQTTPAAAKATAQALGGAPSAQGVMAIDRDTLDRGMDSLASYMTANNIDQILYPPPYEMAALKVEGSVVIAGMDAMFEKMFAARK